eukprot:TRINITY_DN16271_c0_g2_i5.p2 TRINITY_DN16271_c0_g2~~TRINITY_DN16271_c0_g2_i5.p2  ORF type:complete len:227 (-),score=33.35 TRINITY_DN16271_c0_g2_i5:782-1462(-)
MTIQDDTGVQQSKYVRAIIDQRKQIRPIVLVLKALVKSYDVGSVFGGGIGGYTLVNMVIAFVIMREKRELRIDDLGILLTSFLRYFGFGFNYDMHALSIRRGGLVPKASVASVGGNNKRERDEMKLCIEDPITSRDISCGTHRMGEIRYAFGDAYRTLKLASQHLNQLKEEAAVKDLQFQKEFPMLNGFIKLEQFLQKKTRQDNVFMGDAEIGEGDCDLQQSQLGS